MGSGPSAAGIRAGVGSASTDELRSVLAGLPDATRARLGSALCDAQLKRPSLPATLDEVDAEFITLALNRQGFIHQSTRIVSLEKIKFGREKGYLGDKCLLKGITYEPPAPEAPASIFVKLFPTDLVIPVSSCINMWHTEVSFVTRTLRDLPDSGNFKVPQFYFAECDTADGTPPRFVILMEPISAKPYNILTAMPVEHAFRAAKDLAVLHAPYWGWSYARYRSEEDERGFKKFEGYGHMEDAGKSQSFIGLFTMGTKLGLEIFGADGLLSAGQLEDFSGYVEFWRFWKAEIWPPLQRRFGAVVARWTSIPATLSHGDLHVENLFCLEDATNVYIDFQAVNLGPGVRDLAWLIASSLKAEERHEHEKAIIKAYHEALVARGVEYGWEQCLEDFVFVKIHGAWAAMLGAGIFAAKDFKGKTGIFAAEPSDDSISERKRNSALFSRVVDDLRRSSWSAVLQALAEDPEA
mmetsp:Transcript_80600/g.224279  ORF Transcript_80600/g.224279 Transcript_80600/m.224279 type:complete len:467 (-) Transcript_80600:207-1607(-)